MLAFDQFLLALFCHVWVLAGLDFADVWRTVVVFPNLRHIDDAKVLHSLAVDDLRIAEPIDRRKCCLSIYCAAMLSYVSLLTMNRKLTQRLLFFTLSVELSDEARLVVVNDFFGDVFDLFSNLVLQVLANQVIQLGPYV